MNWLKNRAVLTTGADVEETATVKRQQFLLVKDPAERLLMERALQVTSRPAGGQPSALGGAVWHAVELVTTIG